jgi:hypothetical protein
MLNVHEGDTVTIHHDSSGRSSKAVVTRVARKYFYTEGLYRTDDRFSLEDGRSSKDYTWPYATTAEQDALATRAAEADKTLRAHGVRLEFGSRLSVEHLEALAEVARTFPLKG